MKCQKCSGRATIHITELADAELAEFHLCEDHARRYLAQVDPFTFGPEPLESEPATPPKEAAQKLQRTCPVCGTTFKEFCDRGRLGCAHCYRIFGDQLEPLMLNMHGDSEHSGKTPERGAEQSRQRTRLLQLRREMDQAAAAEDYERASQLRDEIRRIEETKQPRADSSP